MPLGGPSYIASATIQPCTIVKSDGTSPFSIVHAAAATDIPVGIAQEGTHDAPGTAGAGTDAADAGEQLAVFTEGDICLLVAGTGGWVVGNLLESDANGNGVPMGAVAGAGYVVARALESANVGEKGKVQVAIFQVNPH